MASQPIYQFRTELLIYKPSMWRRFQVSKNTTVAQLCYIVMELYEMQAFHAFCIEEPVRERLIKQLRKKYTKAEISDFLSTNKIPKTRTYIVKVFKSNVFVENEYDATKVKISQLVEKKWDNLKLLYDYGDGWEVKITLEKIFEDKELPETELPRVLEGEGRGIIEDCGGVYALMELAYLFTQKSGRRYEERSEWLGTTELDLITFDIEDMNNRLKKVTR